MSNSILWEQTLLALKRGKVSFIKKHKIAFIVWGVVFAVLLTIVILIFTLFSLKNIKLDFRSETLNLSGTEIKNEIINSIPQGGSVLFKNKKQIIENLEKNFPYIKVINVETKFPSTFILHIAEREELFALKCADGTLILDGDLKVLKLEKDFVSTTSNAIELDVLSLDYSVNENLVGKTINFLNLNELDQLKATYVKNDIASEVTLLLKSIERKFQLNNRDNSDLKALFKKIAIKFDRNPLSGQYEVCLVILDYINFKTVFLDANNDLELKIQTYLSAYAKMINQNPVDAQNYFFTVYKNSKNEICVAKEKNNLS